MDYEHAGRVAKARILADTLRGLGVTSAEAATYDETARKATSAEAGRRTPSQATWEMVVADLRLHERLAKVTAAEADEFAGL
jgi:hypothetical protein